MAVVELARFSAAASAEFSHAIEKHMRHHPYGWHVEFHSLEDMYAGGWLPLMNTDHTVGLILAKDGDDIDARSLFNVSGIPGEGSRLLDWATTTFGATTLNCYDGPLVPLYGSLGWAEVDRVPFDDQFANDRWNESYGRPDVIFMRHEKAPAAIRLPISILNSPMKSFEI